MTWDPLLINLSQWLVLGCFAALLVYGTGALVRALRMIGTDEDFERRAEVKGHKAGFAEGFQTGRVVGKTEALNADLEHDLGHRVARAAKTVVSNNDHSSAT